MKPNSLSHHGYFSHQELGFFDFYIIPLAKKLDDCGVYVPCNGCFDCPRIKLTTIVSFSADSGYLVQSIWDTPKRIGKLQLILACCSQSLQVVHSERSGNSEEKPL